MRLVVLLVLMALPVSAQSPGDVAQVAADRLEAAQMRMSEARGARDRVAALTETVQAYEAGLAALRDSLRGVTGRTAELGGELARNRTEIAVLISALQNIGRTPAPVRSTHPDGPLGALRAGLMVADLMPALQTRSDALSAQVTELERLRALQQDAITMLTDGMRGAQTARAALGLAIAQRTDLPLRFQDDPIQTALLLASTDTLETFANGLAAGVPDVETDVRATGDLPLPVAGLVTAVDDRPGIAIRALPRALVTTPVAATVLFRGPLLDYGTVMILEPAPDVLFVLAGLAEVFGEPGEILAAGAPLGLLGGEQPDVDSILNQTNENTPEDQRQALYLEVREGQSPVDPGIWFAIDKE